jgi:cysteine desulfurase
VIDFDHHATTPLGRTAREAMRRLLEEEDALGANPSSVHRRGRRARDHVERARAAIARALGAMNRELVFTSGGTEAVHLCVRGIAAGMDRVGGVWIDPGAHPALRAASERAAISRGAAIESMPIDAGGEPRIAALRDAIEQAGGGLVALSWVQHETGAIAPLRAIADAIHGVGGVLVVDAVQAFGKIPIDAAASGARAMAISAHKIGGPTGVGAAWISADARIRTEPGGGGQERGLRAGTENVLGIVGFGAAASLVEERLAAMTSIRLFRDRIEAVVAATPGAVVNGCERERVATACHASLRGVPGEEIVAALDLEGICVSSGPACSSGRPGPSASMRAIYADEPWRADCAVRVTLGVETDESDVRSFVDAWARVVPRFAVRA